MRWILTGAVCVITLLSLIPDAEAFLLHVNMNQFPAEMIEKQNEWIKSRAQCNGLFLFGAPHPFSPMNTEQQQRFVQLFAGRQKVVITKWAVLTGQVTKSVNFRTFGDQLLRTKDINLAGGGATGPKVKVNLWDDSGDMLDLNQLNILQASGFNQKVLINVRTWGREGGTKTMAGVKQVINHPMVAGVVIEGNPAMLQSVRWPNNHRLQIAVYCKSIGVSLTFLQPPSWGTSDPFMTSQRKMIVKLFSLLGNSYMCSDKVTIVPAAYDVRHFNLPFLPEENRDGTAASTFTGGVLFLARFRTYMCNSNSGRARMSSSALDATMTGTGSANDDGLPSLADDIAAIAAGTPVAPEFVMRDETNVTSSSPEITDPFVDDDTMPPLLSLDCSETCQNQAFEMCTAQCAASALCLCACKAAGAESCAFHCDVPAPAAHNCLGV